MGIPIPRPGAQPQGGGKPRPYYIRNLITWPYIVGAGLAPALGPLHSSSYLPLYFSYSHYLHLRMPLLVRDAFTDNCWMARNTTPRWRDKASPYKWLREIMRVTSRVSPPMLMACSPLAAWIQTKPSTTLSIRFIRGRNITRI